MRVLDDASMESRPSMTSSFHQEERILLVVDNHDEIPQQQQQQKQQYANVNLRLETVSRQEQAVVTTKIKPKSNSNDDNDDEEMNDNNLLVITPLNEKIRKFLRAFPNVTRLLIQTGSSASSSTTSSSSSSSKNSVDDDNILRSIPTLNPIFSSSITDEKTNQSQQQQQQQQQQRRRQQQQQKLLLLRRANNMGPSGVSVVVEIKGESHDSVKRELKQKLIPYLVGHRFVAAPLDSVLKMKQRNHHYYHIQELQQQLQEPADMEIEIFKSQCQKSMAGTRNTTSTSSSSLSSLSLFQVELNLPMEAGPMSVEGVVAFQSTLSTPGIFGTKNSNNNDDNAAAASMELSNILMGTSSGKQQNKHHHQHQYQHQHQQHKTPSVHVTSATRRSTWIDVQQECSGSDKSTRGSSSSISQQRCVMGVAHGMEYGMQVPKSSSMIKKAKQQEQQQHQQSHDSVLSFSLLDVMPHLILQRDGGTLKRRQHPNYSSALRSPMADSSRLVAFVPKRNLKKASWGWEESSTSANNSNIITSQTLPPPMTEAGVSSWAPEFLEKDWYVSEYPVPERNDNENILSHPNTIVFSTPTTISSTSNLDTSTTGDGPQIQDKKLHSNSPEFAVHRAIARPQGVTNRGSLHSVVSNGSPDSSVDVKVQENFPTDLLQPLWQTLSLFLYQGGGAGHDEFIPTKNETKSWRYELSDLNHSSFDFFSDHHDDTSYSSMMIRWNFGLTLPPDSRLEWRIDFEPILLPFDCFPADPNRGIHLPYTTATFIITPDDDDADDNHDGNNNLHCQHSSTTTMTHRHRHHPHLLFSESPLLMPPVPDMSMPFNVISLSSTLYAFIVGSIINVLVRKSSERIKKQFNTGKDNNNNNENDDGADASTSKSKLQRIKSKLQRFKKTIKKKLFWFKQQQQRNNNKNNNTNTEEEEKETSEQDATVKKIQQQQQQDNTTTETTTTTTETALAGAVTKIS